MALCGTKLRRLSIRPGIIPAMSSLCGVYRRIFVLDFFPQPATIISYNCFIK